MSYVPKRVAFTKRSKSKSVEGGSSLSYEDLPVLRRKRTLAINRLRKTLEIAESALADTGVSTMRKRTKTLVSRYRDKRELAFTCWREMLNINFKLKFSYRV
ncbi:hypothetical protein ACJJTC_012359 [Scirpophaga incertulas]